MSTVLVTGGASGIGLATAEKLLTIGNDVVVVDRQRCPRPEMTSHLADVTDLEALAEIAGQVGPIAGLACAAGIWDLAGDTGAADISMEVWNRTLAVNLTGTMLTVRCFADNVSDDGAIVTFGSVAALAGMPRRDAYTASKGAIVALTRAWAIDYSRRGIRVNSVCPGPTETPMIEAIVKASEEAGRLIDVPQQRLAVASEIADVVCFLLGPDSSYVSGQAIAIDAGATAGLAGLPFPRRRHPSNT
jgi:NAD(P)-dependent dehydrogenase (short-subunit alcohol dehydrogenase family)